MRNSELLQASTCPACGSQAVREPDDYRREFRLAVLLLAVGYALFSYVLSAARQLISLLLKIGVPSYGATSSSETMALFIEYALYPLLLLIAIRILLVLNASYRPVRLRCPQCGHEHIETPTLTWVHFIRMIITGVRREVRNGS